MRLPRRVATLSVHTSPLHQPGTGDAGGMNVYIVEVSRRLADAGVEVEIFTRATSSDLPRTVEMAPGVTVRHITAGPYEGLSKEELPAQLCAFTAGVLRAEAAQPPGWYDLVHSHYWLSGQVGWLATDRWGVPLVHSAHTLAKVKNRMLADGDKPEPRARVIGEEQVVAEADRLVANTPTEAARAARPLRRRPGAAGRRRARRRPRAVHPAVDRLRDAVRRAARRRLGLPEDGYVVAFVGRIQPLKAPHVLLRAAAELRGRSDDRPAAHDRGLRRPERHRPGAADGADGAGRRAGPGRPGAVPAAPPAGRTRRRVPRADLVGVPSHNESFGLVALEAQACGTPVVAAAVGGLVTAVADGVSGVLIDGHDPVAGRGCSATCCARRRAAPSLARGAAEHARAVLLDATAAGCSPVYREAMSEHRARFALGGGRRERGTDDVCALIEAVCAERELPWRATGEHSYVVTLPGQNKLKTACNLIVGEHALRVEAFVMRQPDENREQLWAWLLQRNARMYGVAFAIDGPGDVYLTGGIRCTPSRPTSWTGCSARWSPTPTRASTRCWRSGSAARSCASGSGGSRAASRWPT